MKAIKKIGQAIGLTIVAALMLVSSLSGCAVVEKVNDSIPDATKVKLKAASEEFKTCTEEAVKQCFMQEVKRAKEVAKVADTPVPSVK